MLKNYESHNLKAFDPAPDEPDLRINAPENIKQTEGYSNSKNFCTQLFDLLKEIKNLFDKYFII